MSKSLARFLPGIERALAHGQNTHSFADVAELILKQKAQLWVEGDALIITEIRQYPQKKILRFWLATGELDAVVALHRKICEWGKEEGCELAIMTGRRGWERVLSDEGWASSMLVLTKEL